MRTLLRKATALFLAVSMVLGMSGIVYAEETVKENVDYEAAVKEFIENVEIPEDMTKEEFEALLKEIVAYIEANGAQILEDAYKYADENGYIEEFKTIVAELEVVVTEKAEEILPELKAELAALKEEVKTAVGDAKDEIEAKIAELEAKIDAIETKVAEAIDAIRELKNAIEAYVKAVEAAIKEGVDAVNKEVQNAINKVKAAVAKVKAAIDEFVELVETVDAAVNATVKDIEAKIDALLKAYEGTFEGEVVVEDELYYIGFGDTVASDELLGWTYVDDVAVGLEEKIAAELGKEVEFSYGNGAGIGLSVTDLIDGFANEEIAAEVADAELISVGFSFKGLIEAAFATTDIDWVQYFGEEGAVVVKEKIAEAAAVLTESGLPEEIANLLLGIVEAFPYVIVEYIANYHEIAAEIHEINPEALVVLVGMYNPFEGYELANGDEVVAIGDFMDKLVEVSNAHLRAAAMLSENTIFVEAAEVDTIMEEEVTEEIALLNYLLAAIDTEDVYFHPSEAGHEYIAEQILNAFTLVEPAVEPGLLGDVNFDNTVDTSDAQAIFNHFMGIATLSEEALVVADITGDNAVDTSDAQAAFNIFMGIN